MAAVAGHRPDLEFGHEALLYAGEREFVEGTMPFIEEGLSAGEPVLVVVGSAKIERLREALGRDSEAVRFADMAEVGTNPARIIPAWREFVSEHAVPGRPVRGIGEPIWADRTAAALVECQRHESLLNLAFADATSFRLLCPYDCETLDEAVIDEALRSHPYVVRDGARTTSDRYRGLHTIAEPFDLPLPEPPPTAHQLVFDADSLTAVRRTVTDCARAAGMADDRVYDLVVAVNEIATNSVRYGGGVGALRVWEDGDYLLCEIADRGRIDDPLVGRKRPRPGEENGRGLWIANQVCELVQVRSFADGSTVRLHMRRR